MVSIDSKNLKQNKAIQKASKRQNLTLEKKMVNFFFSFKFVSFLFLTTPFKAFMEFGITICNAMN